jgi:alpha-glucosidase
MTEINPAAERWRGVVVDLIYPRSSADGNDDDIGDLSWITSNLDYVAQRGVDCIWISPLFASPQRR